MVVSIMYFAVKTTEALFCAIRIPALAKFFLSIYHSYIAVFPAGITVSLGDLMIRSAFAPTLKTIDNITGDELR
jgi:hypothetical protein